MKKNWICNMAEVCQVTGTSETPPKMMGYGHDKTFTQVSCAHGIPHKNCWPSKDWKCDRTNLSSYVLRWRHGERGSQDLIHDQRCCIETTEEERK